MNKIKSLEIILKEYKKVAIAFSGGLDSGFLLYFASKILGKENVIAVTIYSPYKISQTDLTEAKEFALNLKVNHRIFDLNLPEEIKNNPVDRCYYCKKDIFKKIIDEVSKEGYILCDGSNHDDLSDYRPGLQAIKELGVKSPLLEAEFTKSDIRKYAKKFNLKLWDKPPNACLISRLPNNTPIELSIIQMVEKAEEFIKTFGIKLVRVRTHDRIARIEIGKKELKKILNAKKLSIIDKKLKEFGFKYVTLDCNGYKTGSMNG